MLTEAHSQAGAQVATELALAAKDEAIYSPIPLLSI
jgi:hypothetical protein